MPADIPKLCPSCRFKFRLLVYKTTDSTGHIGYSDTAGKLDVSIALCVTECGNIYDMKGLVVIENCVTISEKLLIVSL